MAVTVVALMAALGLWAWAQNAGLPEALELGYTYDNSPRCIRVYEVIPDP